MSTMIRAAGKDFDVDAFLATSSLPPSCMGGIGRKGELRSKHRPQRGCLEESSLTVEASGADFHEVNLQVEETVAFLRSHCEQIQKLQQFHGVERFWLDFGVAPKKHLAAEGFFLPHDLILLASSLRLGIELTHYYMIDEAE